MSCPRVPGAHGPVATIEGARQPQVYLVKAPPLPLSVFGLAGPLLIHLQAATTLVGQLPSKRPGSPANRTAPCSDRLLVVERFFVSSPCMFRHLLGEGVSSLLLRRTMIVRGGITCTSYVCFQVNSGTRIHTYFLSGTYVVARSWPWWWCWVQFCCVRWSALLGDYHTHTHERLELFGL